MKKTKVKWTKPNLIIIGQGRPEENVLDGCKSHSSPSGAGPTSSKSNCNKLNDTGGSCGACSNNGGGIS